MKGFITLATGDIHYYQLACNLVKSYRYRCGQYPFAILCDHKNQYTAYFDKVVLLKNTSGNYLDKLRILVDSPYEENFFIESDCLIYRNIDWFWDCFRNATDFSSFGWNEGDFNIWLNVDDIEKTYHIKRIPLFCPGYLFVRKGKRCEKMYKDAVDISHYIIAHKDRHPKSFIRGHLLDDPVFFLSMKLNECTCVVEPSIGKCIHYPSFRIRNHHHPVMDFGKGYLEDDEKGSCANLCHFSSKHTQLGKYRQQVAAMNCYLKGHTMMGRIIETVALERCFEAYWKINATIQRYIKSMM